MRIGIDGRFLKAGAGGLGRYTAKLIEGILKIDHKNEYFIFYNGGPKIKSEGAKVKWVKVDIPHYSISEQTKFNKILSSYNLDLVHFTHFNHPFFYRGKFVVTIHDLILSDYRQKNPLKNLAYHKVLRDAILKSQKIIAISYFTEKEIIKNYPVSAKKIRVIYEGVDKVKRTAYNEELIGKFQINSKYLLYVGQARPHKNLARLVEAFAKIKGDYQLILVGKLDKYYRQTQRLIEEKGLEKRVILTGFVNDRQLQALYAGATIYVMPSLVEGFGLPPLEAMAAGLPVLASDIVVFREILGEAVGYFKPENIKNIQKIIEIYLKNSKKRQELIKKGNKQILKYRWQLTAEQTLRVYEEIIGEG